MAGPPVIPDFAVAVAQRETPYWDDVGVLFDARGQQVLTGNGPLYPPNFWDSVWLGYQRLPGICTVKCEAAIQIDEQKRPGRDGAKHIPRGTMPVRIEISVLLWTQAQFTWMETLIPKFWRKPNKDPITGGLSAAEQAQLAVPIGALAIPSWFGVEQVIVTKMSGYEDGPQSATKVVRISAVQFTPPTSKEAPRRVVKAPPIQEDPNVVTADPPSRTGVGPRG